MDRNLGLQAVDEPLGAGDDLFADEKIKHK
jgi:hypothetical protein